MQPSKLSVFNLFERPLRYVVPLYQRQYVWTEEAQWAPLWDDVRAKADGVRAAEAAAATGAPAARPVAQEQLDILNAATALGDLRMPQSNRLEALKGDRRGQHSIRINDQYRVVFRWTGSDAADVAVVDYH